MKRRHGNQRSRKRAARELRRWPHSAKRWSSRAWRTIPMLTLGVDRLQAGGAESVRLKDYYAVWRASVVPREFWA